MLQTLREKTSGWIATVVMGLLIVPFAFVGVNEYMSGGPDSSVARVQAPPIWWPSAPSWPPLSLLWQHADISVQDYQRAVSDARRRQQAQLRDAFDAREFDSAANKRKILDDLIDRKVVELAATRAGVAVSDAALREAIASDASFQQGGKFDGATYATILQQNGLTPTTYQQQLREDMTISLVPQGLALGSFVTDQQMDQFFKLMGETRDVTLATLPAPTPDTAPVTDAQATQWYDAHRADFRKPEQVSVEYVEVDASKLPPAPAVDEAELRKRYEADTARFSTEQRLASHILISVPAGADAATQKAAEDKAAKLAEQAKAPGADFAALAKANSQDPGSAENGGDLGWVTRGMMVGPFEQALFGIAKPGEVVGPIKSEFGYHVIKLREVKGQSGKPFEDVRAQLAAEAQKEADAKQYNDVAGKLVTATLDNPDSLTAGAQAAGLQVQKAGPFSRADAPGLLANPQVLRVVFDEQQIADRTASQLIKIDDTHALVVRVTDHSDATDQPLDRVKEQVVAAVRADRSAKAAEKLADDVLARVKKGESLKAIADAAQYQSGQIPGLPRGTPIPSREGSQALFAAPVPEAGKVTPGKARLEDGRFVVFTVDKVTPGDASKLPEAQRDQLRQQVTQLYAGADVQQYIKDTRRKFKVVVHEDKL
ncbi:MAG: peptidylprolyl isomerase [Pseudoxanthomonas spadix]|nr:MAG: peptidylprolyl isomerase [Pseudoxanthomonas spadix]